MSQLLHGSSHPPDYCSTREKYDAAAVPCDEFSQPFNKYLHSTFYSPEETEGLLVSPIFEKLEEKNKCSVPQRSSHNSVNNGRGVNIDLLSNGNYAELRRIEKIAVEAQIEMDQFSHTSSGSDTHSQVRTNPSSDLFSSILSDDQRGRGSSPATPPPRPGPDLSDTTSLLNQIVSSGNISRSRYLNVVWWIYLLCSIFISLNPLIFKEA